MTVQLWSLINWLQIGVKLVNLTVGHLQSNPTACTLMHARVNLYNHIHNINVLELYASVVMYTNPFICTSKCIKRTFTWEIYFLSICYFYFFPFIYVYTDCCVYCIHTYSHHIFHYFFFTSFNSIYLYFLYPFTCLVLCTKV